MSSPAPQPRLPPAADDAAPGLPWFRSWRGVYCFVLGCFVAVVVLLTLFARLYS